MKLKNGTIPPTSRNDSFRHHSELAIKQYERWTVAKPKPIKSPRYVRELKIVMNILNDMIGNVDIKNVDQRTWNTVRQKLLIRKPDMSPKTLHQYKNAIQVVLAQTVFRGEMKESPRFQKEASGTQEDTPRTYFNISEYEILLEALRANIKKHKNTRWFEAACELKDFVIVGINTGLRVFEQMNVRFMDVTFKDEYDDRFKKVSQVLIIRNIVGKRTRGGICKSFFGAVAPFKRCVKRAGLTLDNYMDSDKPIFREYHRDMFREVIIGCNLRYTQDRPPLKRDLKSLRSSYICMGLEAGVDVFQIASNCRTSVTIVQSNYAKHLNIANSTEINKRNARIQAQGED